VSILGLARSKDLELNEVGWWSHWSDVHWIDEKSYVMLSPDFDEYFFNRAGFVDCSNGLDIVAKIEARFEAAGRPPTFSVQSECKELATQLNSRGFTSFDDMSVMQLGQLDFRKATDLKVKQGQDVETTAWADTYALSFYGNLYLQRPVLRIVDRLVEEPSIVLISAEKDGRTLGVLAAFKTSGLLGVYCVGTHQENRRLGVAGSMIHEASKIASAEGRLLVLQTIVSDKVEDFYARGGFRRLYLKHLLRREASGLNRSKKESPQP
jgi:GNAT superfamily N-acetyltransferase